MDYFEFIDELNNLYRKYFKETGGIKNSTNPGETGYIGLIVDELILKMPKGLEGNGKILVSCSRKEYEENGVYAPLKVKGEFFIHETGKTKLLPDELIDEKWTGKYKTTGLFKKFDSLFKKMLKLITGKKNDKFAGNIECKVAKEIVKIAEDLIYADSDYIYDPDHKKHPGGGYHKTEKGWSKLDERDEKKEKSKEKYEIEWEKAQSKHTTPKELDELARTGGSVTRMDVAGNPNTDAKTLDFLSNETENINVVRRVAYHSNTSSETLAKLSKHSDNNVRKLVAANRHTSPETLVALAEDKSYDVRINVAGNTRTPEKTVMNLIEQGGGELLINAAQKSNSKKVIDKVSRYWNPVVREVAGENRSASYKTLKRLSRDNNSGVRLSVARNESTDDETLASLTSDSTLKVQNAARKTLDKKMNAPVKDFIQEIGEFFNMPERERNTYYYPEDITKFNKIKKNLDNFSINVDGLSVEDQFEETDWDLGNGSDVRMYFEDEKVLKSKKCQKVFKEVADQYLGAGHRKFNGYGLSQKFMDVAKTVKSDYASLKSHDRERTESNIETAAYIMGLYSLMPKHNPHITLKTIGYKPEKEIKFDITKLSPEMREKVKDWDAKDIARFIGWIKKQKEEE